MALQDQICHSRQQIAAMQHTMKIAQAMSPDPREWEYTGDVLEGDPLFSRCVCGHPIKYLFPIERKRDGAQLIIGSVCIETTVPYLIAAGADHLAEALQNALAKLEAQLAEARRREKEARNNGKCRALQEHAEALRAWYEELIAQIRRVRPHFYVPRYFYAREYRSLFAPPLSTPGRTAASLARKIKTFHEQAQVLKRWMHDEDVPGWIDPPAMP